MISDEGKGKRYVEEHFYAGSILGEHITLDLSILLILTAES
jgi:hypothetical protein